MGAALLVDLVERLAQRGEGLVGAEVAADVEHPLGKEVPAVVVDRPPGPLDDRLPHLRAKVVLAPVPVGDADDRKPLRQRELDGEVIERRHQLAGGEVARDPEDDDHAGLGVAARLQSGPERIRGDAVGKPVAARGQARALGHPDGRSGRGAGQRVVAHCGPHPRCLSSQIGRRWTESRPATTPLGTRPACITGTPSCRLPRRSGCNSRFSGTTAASGRCRAAIRPPAAPCRLRPGHLPTPPPDGTAATVSGVPSGVQTVWNVPGLSSRL